MSYAQASLMPSFTRPTSRVAIVRSGDYDRDFGEVLLDALEEFKLTM